MMKHLEVSPGAPAYSGLAGVLSGQSLCVLQMLPLSILTLTKTLHHILIHLHGVMFNQLMGEVQHLSEPQFQQSSKIARKISSLLVGWFLAHHKPWL